MIKHTESSHPDYDSLQIALRDIKEVADTVNKSMREREDRNMCFEIQVSLGSHFQLVQAHRKFIMMEDFQKKFLVFEKIRR